MKRISLVLLAFVVLITAGCSKITNPLDKDSTAATKGEASAPTENKTVSATVPADSATAPTESTTKQPQYDPDTPLFVANDRADIEGDSYMYYFYNREGKLLKSSDTEFVGYYAENGLAPAYDSLTKLFGFVDRNGLFVIEPQWDGAWAFSDDGVALVYTKGQGYGYVNDKGEMIAPCIYNEATSFYASGVAIIRENGKYGVLDKTGKVIIESQDYSIEPVLGDYIVCNDNIYDLSGKLLCSVDSDALPDGQYYNLEVTKDAVTRYIYQYTGRNSADREVIKTEVFDGKDFVVPSTYIDKQRAATTTSGYAYGVVSNGKVVIPYAYEDILSANDYYVCAKRESGSAQNWSLDIYNDKFEKTAENLQYGNCSLYTDVPGYIYVSVYDKTNGILRGVIDHTGKIIVPLQYRKISPYTYESAGGLFEDSY